MGKKGSRAHGNRKSRGLRWETADESEKSIVGSRGRKTAEKTRAQSPKSNLGKRGGPLKTTQNKINYILLICFTITEKMVFLNVP